MSLPRYQDYRDSGLAWVGPIPRKWDVVPLMSVGSERRESNKEMVEDNLLSLSYGRIVQKDVTSNDGLLPESFETYQIVHPDDIVLRLTDLQNDKRSLRTAPVSQKGIITSAYLTVVPQFINSRYFAYLLRSYDLTKVFYSMGGGLRQSMKYSDVKRLSILIPSTAEQAAIASFLDRETAKIDALLAEQETLLALLSEKRQATISHAVTRGLDPKAPMKDSGVQWLSEVPAHWRVARLKHLTNAIIDCPHETPIYDAEGSFPVIRTADVDSGELRLDSMYRLMADQYKERTRRAELLKDDIVYGREGERWGHAALVPESNKFCLGQRMMQFRPSQGMSAAYLMWQLNSKSIRLQGEVDTVGATSPHVNVGTIRNYRLAVPPLEEQHAIAAHLGDQSRSFVALAAEAQQAITLLRERRSALIAAAVTGQIDVRGLVEAQAA